MSTQTHLPYLHQCTVQSAKPPFKSDSDENRIINLVKMTPRTMHKCTEARRNDFYEDTEKG